MHTKYIQFIERCNKFASEIKNESKSYFTYNINFQTAKDLYSAYKYALKMKKSSENEFPYLSITCKDIDINELVTFNIYTKHNFTNDQILKILICNQIFYLPYQTIKKIINK